MVFNAKFAVGLIVRLVLFSSNVEELCQGIRGHSTVFKVYSVYYKSLIKILDRHMTVKLRP